MHEKNQMPIELTDLKIKNLAPAAQRFEVTDAKVPGLRIIVQPSGAKSWALRYRFAGSPKKFTLGAYPGLTLLNARKAAQSALGKIATAIDPAAEKQSAREAEKSAARRHDKFEEVLAQYFSAHIDRNLKLSTRHELRRLLTKETEPWRTRRIGSIETPDVHRLLDAMVARNASI